MILQGHRKICYRHDWLDLVLVQSSGLGSFLEKIFFFFKFQDSSEYIQAILLKTSNSSLLPRAQGPSFAESAKGAPVQVETVLKSIFEGLDGGGGAGARTRHRCPPLGHPHTKQPQGAPHAGQLGMMTRAQKYRASETYHIWVFSLFPGTGDPVSLGRKVPYRRSFIIY